MIPPYGFVEIVALPQPLRAVTCSINKDISAGEKKLTKTAKLAGKDQTQIQFVFILSRFIYLCLWLLTCGFPFQTSCRPSTSSYGLKFAKKLFSVAMENECENILAQFKVRNLFLRLYLPRMVSVHMGKKSRSTPRFLSLSNELYLRLY